MKLDPGARRRFLSRAWGTLDRRQLDHWKTRIRRLGLREAFQVMGMLHDHMRTLHPEWPTAKDREEDLETHRRVAKALARSARRR